MKTQWMLQNRGEVVGTTGKFLRDVWLRAGLKGMVVPRRMPGTLEVKPHFTDDWLQLDGVDPFAPIMKANAARLVAQLARERPRSDLGAVLRPCEAHALVEMVKCDSFRLDRLVIIGVDCLGTFPTEDYAWRAERWGVEHLTREALQFARQGGILPYRFRFACQICNTPMPEAVDLSIDVLGLPVRQVILVTARDAETAKRLHLDEITDAEATPALIAQHEQMRATLVARHARARGRIIRALPADLPTTVDELKAHLADCAPCQACLEACPLYAGEFSPLGNGGTTAAISHWLAACVECGMCEEACPKHVPLTALFDRLSRTLSEARV